jgi:hypothetical protein
MAGTTPQHLQQQQLAQAEAALVERGDSVDPEEADRMRQHEILLRQQEYEENERKRQHELEMAKLQLQIEQAKAKAANTTPAAINIIQQEDGSFKLEGSTNHESWYDEAFIQALTQALATKAKHILINKEKSDSTPSTPSTSSTSTSNMANSAGDITGHEITPQGDSIHVIPRNTAILGTTPKAVGASTNILDPIRAIPKAVGASTNILDPIRAIPKAVGASTTIFDLIWAIPKAVGATNKEEMTDQALSRSGIPRRRRGRLKLARLSLR